MGINSYFVIAQVASTKPFRVATARGRALVIMLLNNHDCAHMKFETKLEHHHYWSSSSFSLGDEKYYVTENIANK